ncbi:hypothetical protein C8R47DRAFT_218917 [Mycena vitilis]|nr:hypothetical protein C8R47DRAFT_218917 [Mycena vitilis]
MLSVRFVGIGILASISGVHAQATFVWGFDDTVTSLPSLPSCQTLPLWAAANGADNGVPPFYLTAFPVGGTPITAFIGTNASNLSWQVQYPTGTQLLLGAVDSKGSTGGIGTSLYTVTAGASTECIPPTSTDFNITANVTNILTACQPWGLKVQGGTPPYTVTIVELDSPLVTNVTMGPTDSVFTYINIAKDNSHMIASVSDKNGRWATGSPFVHTTGTSSNACAGLASTSGNGTSTTSQGNIKPTSSATTSSSSQLSRPAKIGAIVGGSIAGLLLLVALGLWATWSLRRRAEQKEENKSARPDLNTFMPPSFQPSPFDYRNVQMSGAHMSAPSSLAPVPHSIAPPHSESGQMPMPGFNSSSDAPWATAHPYNNYNSTSVPAPTSASPLILHGDLPTPPAYRSNAMNIASRK